VTTELSAETCRLGTTVRHMLTETELPTFYYSIDPICTYLEID
jgi:hypothetical protein